MNQDTKRFIYSIEQKMAICFEEVSKSIQSGEQECFKKNILNILIDVGIMVRLTEVYMLIEQESTKELEQLQDKLVQGQIYFETEYTKLKMSIQINTI
ncbi:hypothetical protein [Bacillus wiedmannii]|uniref:hypothetical protein n=1 Tax=Bacillus wiedmannii TaxID=1890302 RepID=UPI000D03A5F2|nr:hypothetical protein [Bacillus wiedmannii]PRT34015.1 hypothetical protein C6358_06870 [Bacillus wiedmannii]PRT45282.1 hypothetical protein C6359_06930 [Bacillus wiedmannii]